MPSLLFLILLTVVTASIFGGNSMFVDGSLNYSDVEVQCLPEVPGKQRKCSGVTNRVEVTDEANEYFGGWEWVWEIVDSRYAEGGLDIGETDYDTIKNFRTGETIQISIGHDGGCTITVNDTETCNECLSRQGGCFDSVNPRVRYDCTNLENGNRSPGDDCVRLEDPFFYPFGLLNANGVEDVAEYNPVDPRANLNVELYDTPLPDCYEREALLIKRDSITVPVCDYDPNLVEIVAMNTQQVTIKINDIWSRNNVAIPDQTQVYFHSNGLDSILRHDESDNFQCTSEEGVDLTVGRNTGSEEFDVTCYQSSATDPFLASIDLVITDESISGSNEVGHPCYDHYEPILNSCSWRLIIPCETNDICASQESVESISTVVEESAESTGLCEGKTQTSTEIDIYNSNVVESTLHEPNGRLVFENVGIVRDRPVNLVVTVYDGEYTTSVSNKNGKSCFNSADRDCVGMFGSINMQTYEGDNNSGEGNFEFCFRDPVTEEKVVVDSFMFSVFDMDERDVDPRGIKEKLIIDTSQVHDFKLTPNREESEVKLFCESFTLWDQESLEADPYQLPCPEGDRTVFHSSTKGKGNDNPIDKDDMTDQQQKRSILFTFVDTSCFRFTFSHYCPPDEAGADVGCLRYTGGNFQFAGEASQLIEEGECITQSPTVSPTASPTKKPTVSPTASPTQYPTTSPTTSPTKNPTVSPTAFPTKNPTVSPTASPTKSPTVEPTLNPTASPTKTPTASPTRLASAVPSDSFAPSSAPSDSPSLSSHPSSLPSSTPSSSPSSSPSSKPSSVPSLSPSSSPSSSPSDGPSSSPSASPSAAPSGTPSESPSGSFYPSANPSASPSKSMYPSTNPTDVPSKVPTPIPTVEPTASPTKVASASPSGSFYPSANPTDVPTKSMSPSTNPTDVPTKAPTPRPSKKPTVEPTNDPTVSPTPIPTIEPTKNPTALPTPRPTMKEVESVTKEPAPLKTKVPTPIIKPGCDDVFLYRQKGETEIDLDRVVKVVSQDKSTVTVNLTQGWEQVVADLYVNNNDYYYAQEDKGIDHIFYSYRQGNYSEQCYEETEVVTDALIDTIEITCFVTKPFALLEICLVDDLDNGFLTSKDNAIVPECCESPSKKPTVCYKIDINCVPCVDDTIRPFRRRQLRRRRN